MISKEDDCICPECHSGILKHRDVCTRKHKIAGGEKELYIIERCKCDKCGKMHRMLPDTLIPYKQYDAGLIEDVVDEVLTDADPGTDEYPCEGIQKKWKAWISKNITNIDGMLKSVGYNLFELGKEFLQFAGSLLTELRERISPGWLPAVIRLIYNYGKRITPLGRFRIPGGLCTDFCVMSKKE